MKWTGGSALNYGLKPEVWSRVGPDPKAGLQVDSTREPQAQGLGRESKLVSASLVLPQRHCRGGSRKFAPGGGRGGQPDLGHLHAVRGSNKKGHGEEVLSIKWGTS